MSQKSFLRFILRMAVVLAVLLVVLAPWLRIHVLENRIKALTPPTPEEAITIVKGSPIVNQPIQAVKDQKDFLVGKKPGPGVMLFWHATSLPSLKELDDLISISKANKALNVTAIAQPFRNIQEEQQVLSALSKEQRMIILNAIGSPVVVGLDYRYEYLRNYNLLYVPVLVVYDKDHKVSRVFLGYTEKEKVEKAIKAVL
jgi:hypothetical protein